MREYYGTRLSLKSNSNLLHEFDLDKFELATFVACFNRASTHAEDSASLHVPTEVSFLPSSKVTESAILVKNRAQTS